MKTWKKIIIAIAVLLLVLAGVLFFVFRNLDSIVKSAIEKYGSEITKTAVRVSSVKIKLSSGKGAIKGLTVSNPKGFSSSNIFSLGKISTKVLKPGTLPIFLILFLTAKILSQNLPALYEKQVQKCKSAIVQ